MNDRSVMIVDYIKFKYHPNLAEDEILIRGEGICQCCGKKVTEYIEQDIYAKENIDCLCLNCISDGSAAAKFDAEFVQDAESVSDPEKRDELFHRTPGYLAWQGEYWLACCDDYCQYLGVVGIEELDQFGIKDEVLREYFSHSDSYPQDILEQHLKKDGDMTGYLFRCLHCRRYRLYVDAN
ncbi:MAG: CbrC family protein [Bacteroidales bacterium]|nr:CbrC family protein [Bacteroidales bacterium]